MRPLSPNERRRREFLGLHAYADDDDEDDVDDDDQEEDDDYDDDDDPSSSASARRRLRMKCLSCKEDYDGGAAGTCRECYEEAGETEEALKLEIDELKSKVNFLRLLSPNSVTRANIPCFSDVILVACGSPDSPDLSCSAPSIPAHRAVLASRSPVFRAMLETEMEESLSGMIKMTDVSYDALRAFVNYLYTAEACLDEQMACDLLLLAEKYQVKHLKTHCERYLMSKLKWENSLPYYAFAHQHGASTLLDAASSLILDNMDKVTKREDYCELVEKDPRVVVDIYEAYLAKQVNTAASKDPAPKAL